MTPEIDKTLRAAGEAADDALDLAEVGLALAAADLPDVDLAPYRAHLRRLAADVGARAEALIAALPRSEGRSGGDPGIDAVTRARAHALADVISGDYGYDGDRVTYDDMANANLVRVIDRRRGLPVALGLLYIHAGRVNGWRISGVNFPGHFLLRLNGVIAGGPPPVLIDPFSGGRLMDEEALQALYARVAGADEDGTLPGEAADLTDHIRPVPARMVVLRLLNNIYSRAVEAKDVARGASIIARMTAIAPRDPALWLERGRLETETGSLMSARSAYTRAAELAMSMAGKAGDTISAEARTRLETLRRTLN